MVDHKAQRDYGQHFHFHPASDFDQLVRWPPGLGRSVGVEGPVALEADWRRRIALCQYQLPLSNQSLRDWLARLFYPPPARRTFVTPRHYFWLIIGVVWHGTASPKREVY